MTNFCKDCGRPKHKGLCDMALIFDGRHGSRTVHANRLDKGGDLHQDVEDGRVKVVNRFIKKDRPKSKPKTKARKT